MYIDLVWLVSEPDLVIKLLHDLLDITLGTRVLWSRRLVDVLLDLVVKLLHDLLHILVGS